MTKETILKYNGFVDNEYLDQYLELVNNKVEKTGALQRHHVIPAYGYKLKFPKLQVGYRTVANNDIEEELVILTIAEHIKAHELLANCTTGPLQEKMLAAYTYMITPRPTVKKPATKKSRKKYASKAEWPSRIKAAKKKAAKAKNKAINKIAAKILHKDRNLSGEECKAEATIIYEQSTGK